MPLDITSIRAQFPILSRSFDGNALVYLDNAATSQKPTVVLDAMQTFYKTSNANINRGVHILAEQATIAYDDARKEVQTFINAKNAHEIIFTRNTTEAINLVAKTWGSANLKAGDFIALSLMEHHSNIVPWQELKQENGADLLWINVDSEGNLDLTTLTKALTSGSVKLLTISGLSNVLGVHTPLQKLITLAHKHGALVLVDAAQLAAHDVIDVQALDCDFLAFSGHKVYGPMGIGILYAKAELLEAMPPFLGGGDMIGEVTTEGFTVAELPRKFEAGTPSVADTIGLAAALKWLSSFDRTAILEHESQLLTHAADRLSKFSGIHLLGPSDPAKRASCISFTLDGIHPHDLTEVLGRQGICLRAGHHCTQPLHKHLDLIATSRLSVAAYNTMEEIDRCIEAMEKAQKKLHH